MPVDTHHPDYDRFRRKWKRCRDTYNGQDAVHDAGEEYLPSLVDQDRAEYDGYKMRAVWFNATYRTISGLVGMMFRQPLKFEAGDDVLEMAKDITLGGMSLFVFSQKVATEALHPGRVGVLCDFPTVVPRPDGSAPTLMDAKVSNYRPTLQMYKAEQIINWKTRTVNNKILLTLIVLQEDMATAKDEFEDKIETVFRVLDLAASGFYRVRRFKREKLSNGTVVDVQIGGDIFPMMQGKPMDFIPFIFISADDLTPTLEDPPFIDLVDLNISHYRSTADLENGAHFTGLPTPVVTGARRKDDTKLYIGSHHAWFFPEKDADAKYLEFTGTGLEALEKRLEVKEKQMAVIGARMLEPQKRQVETTETTAIHRKGEESLLANFAQVLSEGMTIALNWFAKWAGSAQEVVFEINRDFFPTRMAPAELTALVSAWQQGAISDQTLFDNLKKGEIIAQEVEADEELARIEDRRQQLLQEQQIADEVAHERRLEEEETKAAVKAKAFGGK